jgi:DNA-binding transcriptional regulator YiaG
VTAYRLDHAGTRSNVGVPVASAVTISPRGEVFDGPVSTEPGPTGEHAVMVWHTNVVDEPLAAFLVDRGMGHRLRPISDEELASPRTEAMRVATPPYIARWYRGEVEAGRIVPAQRLQPVSVRRQLRESAGLTRPQAAAQLGVSKDALRLWETGAREPQGGNLAAYLSLLASWQDGPQQPAQKPAEPEPEPGAGLVPRSDPQSQPGSQPGREPLTNADHRETLAAAIRAHKARMRTVHGRPA